MNIYRNFKDHVVQAAMQSTGFDQIADHHKFIRSITVEPPRDAANGDLATNVAMVLARPLAKKPREIAAFITERLCKLPDVASAEIAGAGFINIRLGDNVWLQTIEDILYQGRDFARPKMDARRKINVEYVSANPTGPLHLGHCRGAVVGDCLANLLSFAGHDVTREYYVNDAGAQVDILVRSCLLRYRQARGENIGAIPEGMYPGEYLIPVGKALFEHYSDKLIPMETQEACALIRPFCLSAMLDLIRNDLARLGIAHDVFFHEQTLHKKGGEIDIVLKQLAEEGLTYHGQLPPPKGKDDGDWEPREQLLFYASRFGDDTDRALRKADGSATYFLAEIAYLRSKFKRGFHDMLFVLGADHGGYLKRLEAAGRAVSAGKARINVNVCQMVKLLRKGAPVKMSKRAGEFVSLNALLDEVGNDAVRYMMVSRKNDSPVNFDFDIMKEKSKENPVFYIQYAFTRCRSVFRQAVTADVDVSGIISRCHKVLNQQPEMTFKASEYVIIRKLADFPRQIELAVDHEEPHRIALYLYELAALFHAHWNLGKESPQLRFINPFNKHLTEKRLILVKAIETVLGEGLRLLGVTAPEEMR